MIGLGVIKPVIKDFKKINPSTLGWIRPDKSISFATEEAAMTYSKNRVLKALHAPLPYERGVIVNKNVVLKEIDGNAFQIGVSIEEVKTTGATFLHGHPTMTKKGTLPLSLGDFITQINAKFKKMIAYNSEGEYNMLEEKPHGLLYKMLPKKVAYIIDILKRIGTGSTIVPQYVETYVAAFPKELKTPARKMLYANIDNPLYGNEKLAKEGKELLANTEMIKKMKKFETQWLNSEDAPKTIDKFWRDNADKVGYKYTTNFSNLK